MFIKSIIAYPVLILTAIAGFAIGGATSVNISLRIKGSDLSLTIIDNGIGIKKAVIAGAGMHKISEFGATYSFTQNLDRGAELFINVPLNK